MLRIFLLVACFCLSQQAFAQKKTPQTLDQINADLIAKKAAMEPFDSKKVKVDLESLGLDDLDKQDAKKKVEAQPAPKIVQPIEKIVVEEVAPKVEEKPAPNQEAQSKEADVKNSENVNFNKKIQNFLQEDELKKDKKPAKKIKEESINPIKKKNQKKRTELQKQRLENEKKRAEKSKKLEELRQNYLIKIDEKSDDFAVKNEDEDEEKIIPKPKEINPFILEELPAPPILSSFRTEDNLHIPLIPTIEERTEFLFDSILSDNVALFNNAYKNVENPNARNKFGDSILSYAIILQKHSIIASVLTRGANPDLPNSLGYKPLDLAIEMLDFKTLEFLVKNNADIKYVDIFGRSYLMNAARLGFLPAVELFISQGVDVNAMDVDGFTALSIAYHNKKELVVKFLLKNGAKPWIEEPYKPEKQSLIKELETKWK